VGKVRTLHSCSACGQHVAQWVGRCPGCGEWGTVEQQRASTGGTVTFAAVPIETLSRADEHEQRRIATGFPDVDRVLGGGLVPGSVTLLAGEPGIGKSTLLLQSVAHLSAAGLPCLLASGEESRSQVAARARRLGLRSEDVSFVPGRELDVVLQAARSVRPVLLAVDSIQSLRDVSGSQMAGGPSQVRGCTDALVGLAKSEGITVVLTGHVTKDGDVAGPRTLEHAVDVVLSFDGDPRSGLRMLSGGKNRFGREGEVAWFEMTQQGLRAIDAAGLLRSTQIEPGAATALPLAGRRAIAVEVQALVSPGEGPGRRQATGLDPRRFHLVTAVVDRVCGVRLGAEVFGATLGGLRVDDPASDLAVAAALASAASAIPAPTDAAFVGELGLTGLVRPAPAMAQRLAAARVAGCVTVYSAGDHSSPEGVRVVPVRHVRDALAWISRPRSATRGARGS
jgi:DNA repair protein RadA/Sms